MSYDLMVFDKEQTPNNKEAFLQWYDEQTKWAEPHDYATITVTTPALQKWYQDMVEHFPNMNLVDEELLDEDEDNELESHLTEYSIGYAIIYTAFAWSVADKAYSTMKELAKKHGVGFFDVSGEGEIF
ncbi:hypothetical protein [Lysinibacillus xylanilyticus]|uniref:Uncharacterized protein n=1 Tax=Lysinibacillus xylanilyticus TaxID=582475 RepID=A0ABT4EV51_9BACI|nr:hypothetical protein [Lysinibacillus xylanilyticus]MCY9548898.1 hypothetical protein [Lysinibacillus xylanilyticus]MED3803493.1 hypothetical protein [Lysinibacillus xylanilyticus]